jgi:hypothetical protein
VQLAIVTGDAKTNKRPLSAVLNAAPNVAFWVFPAQAAR